MRSLKLSFLTSFLSCKAGILSFSSIKTVGQKILWYWGLPCAFEDACLATFLGWIQWMPVAALTQLWRLLTSTQIVAHPVGIVGDLGLVEAPHDTLSTVQWVWHLQMWANGQKLGSQVILGTLLAQSAVSVPTLSVQSVVVGYDNGIVIPSRSLYFERNREFKSTVLHRWTWHTSNVTKPC